MDLFADYNLPFAVALATMLLLALAQAVGLGSLEFEADGPDLSAEADGAPGAVEGLVSLLGIGRLPFVMWLALFLLLFAALGVSIQSWAGAALGSPLDSWAAAGLAVLAALPAAGLLARPMGRLMLRDDTTAVSLNSLVGRRGRILTGRAAAGRAARAQVDDRHGQPHLVMVEPHEAGAEMLEGDEVLLVRRGDSIFYCVALQDHRLGPVKP